MSPASTIGTIRVMAAVVDVESLGKRYKQTEALRDVSFKVSEGETFGYIGPNGAGKTTTIRILLGLIQPTSGSAMVMGRSVSEAGAQVLEGIGYVPGEFGLWPSLTGAECLTYLASLNPRPARRQKELCDRFEMASRDLAKQTRYYSRGMRQKIAIIQAFQHSAPLVILDEPSEGLDPVMKERLIGLVNEHRSQGGAALFSSHILSEVEQCVDRVGVIRGGSLIKVAAPEALSEQRVRRCSVTFTEDVDITRLQVRGVTSLTGERRLYTFEFTGPMRPLMRALVKLPVEEFLCERESLSDSFLDLYREPER